MPTPEEVKAGVDAFMTLIGFEEDETLQELYESFDVAGIVQAVLAAAEGIRQPIEVKNRNERVAFAVNSLQQAISTRIRENSNRIIRDPKSDGVDGYCAAMMLDLANLIEVGQ